jgi:hypothetical protein
MRERCGEAGENASSAIATQPNYEKTLSLTRTVLGRRRFPFPER